MNITLHAIENSAVAIIDAWTGCSCAKSIARTALSNPVPQDIEAICAAV